MSLKILVIKLKPAEPIRGFKWAVPRSISALSPPPTEEDLKKIFELEDESVFNRKMRKYRKRVREWNKEHPEDLIELKTA